MVALFPPPPTIRLARGPERRGKLVAGRPPYITEEGLVLVDRRSQGERRHKKPARGALAAAA